MCLTAFKIFVCFFELLGQFRNLVVFCSELCFQFIRFSVFFNKTAFSTLKPVLDQIASLTAALKEKSEPAQQPTRYAATPTGAQAEMQRKIDAEMQRIAVERAKLKVEQEEARKAEVERQRRRLYPEYYAAQDRAAAAAAEAERALAKQQPAPL
ncbi:MAG: hypothetical protein IIZ29_01980, partial [Schwartzia sp.]|nr:hypothetical protein [Schwartzia sp. (in: firmicutes)]